MQRRHCLGGLIRSQLWCEVPPVVLDPPDPATGLGGCRATWKIERPAYGAPCAGVVVRFGLPETCRPLQAGTGQEPLATRKTACRSARLLNPRLAAPAPPAAAWYSAGPDPGACIRRATASWAWSAPVQRLWPEPTRRKALVAW